MFKCEKKLSIEVPIVKQGKWKVCIPASKSLSNRAIHLASLSKGVSYLHNILWSIDTKIMMTIWQNLGAKISSHNSVLEIQGCGNPKEYKDLLCSGNAGTVARFVGPALCLGKGEYFLSGDKYMKKRPIGDLSTCMRQLGSNVEYIQDKGFLPLKIGSISSSRLDSPLHLSVDCEKSSQYLSGLLMMLPLCKHDTKIKVKNNLVSEPYVQMTLALMQDFGITIKSESSVYSVKGKQTYKPCKYFVESDFSSASYFLALAAITGSEIVIPRLLEDSLQGDANFIQILERMGCSYFWRGKELYLKGAKKLRSINVDMKNMTDVVPSLCAVALFAEGETRISGIEHMKYKECNRIEALITELSGIGANICYDSNQIIIQGGGKYSEYEFHTYNDHRMAMSFAVVASQIGGCRIRNYRCVDKTFPNFFENFISCV